MPAPASLRSRSRRPSSIGMLTFGRGSISRSIMSPCMSMKPGSKMSLCPTREAPDTGRSAMSRMNPSSTRTEPRSITRSGRTVRKSLSHMVHLFRGQVELAVDEVGDVGAMVEHAELRDAGLLQRGQAADQRAPRIHVERGGGLVQHQQALRQDERAGEVHLLLLAA